MGGVSASENPPRNGEGDRAKRGGGGSPRALRPETVVARQLRKEMSLPEVLLWQRLRGRKAGVKFRNQHPVGPYVVDFYCRESQLIIEVDGEVHNRGDRPMRDEMRDIFLRENGYNVMHVPAADILKDADDVAASIAMRAARPLHDPSDGSPPRPGEDFR